MDLIKLRLSDVKIGQRFRDMKTKEELLQSIYGAEYIHADINGWMKYRMYHPNDLGFDNDEIDRYGDMDLWRPKTLNGIDDNFGWISINSEKDLPKVKDEQIVFFKDGITTTYLSDDVAEDKKFFTRYSHYKIKEKQINPIFK